MNTTPSPEPAIVKEACTILIQLGGNKFLVITGAPPEPLAAHGFAEKQIRG